MSPRILIVDDEAPARQRMRELLSDIHAEFPTAMLAEAGNAQQALTQLQASKFDIVLLDVQMPGMDGMQLAQQIRSHAAYMAPAIIFVTAHDDYALRAFELHARDYLLKPVRARRLAEALQHALALCPASQGTPELSRTTLTVTEKNRQLCVPLSDILFVRAEQKYLSLHTADAEYWLEGSLSALEIEFSATLIRIHRNTLAARNAILGVEKAVVTASAHDDSTVVEQWQVVLRGSRQRLPVSRRQWPVLKDFLRK